jgi:hypothetical protein
MKACSTLAAFFALVSKKGIPISSAKAYHIQEKPGHEKLATTKDIGNN